MPFKTQYYHLEHFLIMFNGWSSEEVVVSELKSIARWSSCCSWRQEEYEEMWRGGSRSGDKSRNHCNVNKVKHLIQKGFCLNSVTGSTITFFVLLFQHLLQSRSLILNLRLKKELLKGESFLFWSQSFLVLTSSKINCSFWRVELMWNLCLHSSRNNTDRCWPINCKSNQPSKDQFGGSERNPDRHGDQYWFHMSCCSMQEHNVRKCS